MEASEVGAGATVAVAVVRMALAVLAVVVSREKLEAGGLR